MAPKAQQRVLMVSASRHRTNSIPQQPCTRITPLLTIDDATSRMSISYHNVNPASQVWTYQGSNAQSRVEYWAKDGCKMDYHPTTGSVKTSMDHPSQGKTQMFRRGLDDAGFQQVLNNPRHHTGQGYQKRPANQ